mgnify:CR=1 FL=1
MLELFGLVRMSLTDCQLNVLMDTMIITATNAPIGICRTRSASTRIRNSRNSPALDRWRATFARELQDRGINAVATRQPVGPLVVLN